MLQIQFWTNPNKNEPVRIFYFDRLVQNSQSIVLINFLKYEISLHINLLARLVVTSFMIEVTRSLILVTPSVIVVTYQLRMLVSGLLEIWQGWRISLTFLYMRIKVIQINQCVFAYLSISKLTLIKRFRLKFLILLNVEDTAANETQQENIPYLRLRAATRGA